MSLDDLDESLAIFYVSLPDSIATDYYKLIKMMFFECTDIWFTGYHLLVVPQLLLGFVVEVPEGSRQIETTVYPAHVDCAPCFFYSGLLLLTLGFVID